MNPAIFGVLAIGLRHGADPDHLAAIDNLTRNSYDRMPRTSRFCGTLFAVGHTATILITAGLAAALGAAIVRRSEALESAGSIASIAVLLVMIGFNISMLVRGAKTTPRMRVLPKTLREATNPLMAIPTGALFGLGFETSSQLLAFGSAFSSASLATGLFIGAVFCLGMISTDTFDSLFVARLIRMNPVTGFGVRKIWIIAVTIVALGVAAEEIAALAGHEFGSEIAQSAIVMAILIGTAAYALLRRTGQAAVEPEAAA